MDHRTAGNGHDLAEIRGLYACGEADAALHRAAPRGSRRRLPLDAVPVAILHGEPLLRLPLDSRSGFVLARVDGVTSIRGIVHVAAMPVDAVLDILDALLDLGALALTADGDGDDGDDDEPTSPRAVAPARVGVVDDDEDDEPTERRASLSMVVEHRES